MNSHSENLRYSTLSLLQKCELENKALLSQLDAAMHTNQYAAEATKDAFKKLEAAKKNVSEKADVKELVQNISNGANALLMTATQSNSQVKNSITNTSVCAANVQVAASAVVRLASDIGAVYAIVNSADSGSELSAQTKALHDVINKTAYAAEKTSQLAMEVSIATSEISAAMVNEKAKIVSDLSGGILKQWTKEYDDALAACTALTTNHSLAIDNQSHTAAVFHNLTAGSASAQSAYEALNKALNLNLQVRVENSKSFSVAFDSLQSPFASAGNSIVKQYYIFLVKESKKSVFSIADAERIVMQNESGFIVVADGVNQKIPFIMKDSDGDLPDAKNDYVVFLFALLSDEYKKLRNNFDDYLSAPSLSFNCLEKPAIFDSLKEAQIKVDMLTNQYEQNQAILALADAQRSQSLAAQNEMDRFQQNVSDVKMNAALVFIEAQAANTKSKALAQELKKITTQLIYCAELTNKLANLIVRQKAMNPLISDELVAMIGAAGKDANNAVALTLVASESTFSALLSNMEALTASSLTKKNAAVLYQTLSKKTGLKSLVDSLYKKAVGTYEKAYELNNHSITELNAARIVLNNLQTKEQILKAAADAMSRL